MSGGASLGGTGAALEIGDFAIFLTLNYGLVQNKV